VKRLTLLLGLILSACAARQQPLRVCADPNNLPFSNADRRGFENEIASLISRDLDRPIVYTWWAQRRGYVRNTLTAGTCDLWPGVASGVEMLDTTRPYYRSTYVFVTRADHNLDIKSFDDARLRRLKIGVQLVGNDAMNTPPAHALARRGIIDNVRGYMLYGDYSRPNPPAAIVEAVDRGDIDVAVVWGPLAGYFAQRSHHPLILKPVRPWLDSPQWPMVFDISMGVRKDDPKFKRTIETILNRETPQIGRILKTYGVPLAPASG
jgi:mxaJ protein